MVPGSAVKAVVYDEDMINISCNAYSLLLTLSEYGTVHEQR